MNIFYHLPRGLSLTLVVIVLVAILVLMEKIIAPSLSYWGEGYPLAFFLLVTLSKVAVPLLLLRWRYGVGHRSLGWVEGGCFEAVWKGAVIALLMMVIFVFYKQYSPLVFHRPYAPSGERLLGQEMSCITVTMGVIAALLNALGEEIIFRGMLLPSLSIYVSKVPAVILQAFFFSAYHLFPLQNSFMLFIMGILFGAGYLWSGSLLTPVVAHLIENGVPIALFIVSVV